MRDIPCLFWCQVECQWNLVCGEWEDEVEDVDNENGGEWEV